MLDNSLQMYVNHEHKSFVALYKAQQLLSEGFRLVNTVEYKRESKDQRYATRSRTHECRREPRGGEIKSAQWIPKGERVPVREMPRKGGPTLAACFIFAWFHAGAAGQRDLLLHRHLQENETSTSCSSTWELTASSSSSGPSEIRSALAEAGECAIIVGDVNDTTPSVVSVRWEGSIQTEEPFVVPSGVELRVVGDGWFSSYEDITNSSSDNGEDIQEADAELEAAIADAAAAGGQNGEPSAISSSVGNTSLFVVEAGGALRLSKIALSGAWGGVDGGGAVRSVGGEVTGEDLWWKSLAAEGAGGAIFADDGANVTLKGLNLFQGCSSSTRGGGALFVENSNCFVDNSAQVYFESCSAITEGGCVELSSSTLTASSNSKTRFRGCSTGDKGGGMYIRSSTVRVDEAASLEFQGCTSGNVSGAKGGGIYSYESTVAVGTGATVTFVDNSSPFGDGGGLFGQTTYIEVAGDGAALVFTDNFSGDSGGGLALEMLDTDEEKDCFALAEGSNAYFSGNEVVEYGGGAVFTGCYASVSGNISFRENIGERAGALYLDEARLLVNGDASFVGNSAHRWGGAVYVLDSVYAEDNGVWLTGGVDCSGNAAGRSGGCIYIENGDVTIARDLEGEGEGTSWVGNTAGYDGGVVAVDGGGVLLEGGYASSNSAIERGGALFGIGESTVVWQGGESWNNTAAAGGSLYVSGSTANLTDLRLDGDHTPSGANIFLAAADVRAVNVSMVAPEDLEATFALHVDSGSMFRAFACSFDQWGGDSPAVVSGGELVMDVCDFSGSTTPTLVHASRAVTIRNAILGDNNRGQAGFNASSLLGVGVHTCTSIPEELSCTVPDKCLDADNGMGVLCPSFTEAAAGGLFSLAAIADESSPYTVELTVTTSSANLTSSLSEVQVVYHPELVTHELALRHTASTGVENDPIEGAGGVLWELQRMYDDGGDSEGGQSADENGEFTGISPDNFTWTALPSSGLLVWGQEVTIQVVGNPPLPLDPSAPFAVYNGEVSAEFSVLWWMEEPDSAVASSVVTVESMFYYCREGYFWDGETCVSCVEEMAAIDEGEGALDCSIPGVTLDTLPLAKGYWRGDITKTYVHECLNPSACVGGRGIESSSSSSSEDENDDSVAVSTAILNATTSNTYDDSRYCVEGHKGAYCSVCADGYRRFSGGQLCVSCTGGWSSGLQAMLWALAAVACYLLMTLVVFLIGGVSAISQLKKRLAGFFCFRRRPKAVATGFIEFTAAPSTGSAEKIAAKTFGARMLRAVPFQKLKILIVVWQILTQFSHLADVPYPRSYQRFLNLLDVFNFDITWPLTASCLVVNISFYQRLLGVTLGPLAALAFLGTTYVLAMNMHRWGFGQMSAEARQGVVVRHASAALLVLFLVFSSVSTTAFSTYACDLVEDLDEYLLRADYSISCDDPEHLFYEVYAAFMILLYPVGIPVLFAVLLLKRRDKINPSLAVVKKTSSGSTSIESSQNCGRTSRSGTTFDERGRGDYPDAALAFAGTTRMSAVVDGGSPSGSAGAKGIEGGRRKGVGDGGRDTAAAPAVTVGAGGGAAVSFEEVLKNRAHDPDLQSTRFLWEPYDPDNYYYETVECGRRCLLTGALVFVLPNTAGQAAGACVFGFVSLLAFELLRPHLSHTDAWMYRVGCIVIFFSNFLALMAKADVSDEEAQSQEVFGIVLIAVHASMVIAVIAQVYVSMQAAAESRDDLEARWMKDTKKHFETRDITSAAEGSGVGSGGSTGAPVVASGVGGRSGVQAGKADGAAVSERGGDADHQHKAARGWEEMDMSRRERRRQSDKSNVEQEEEKKEKEKKGVESWIEMESVWSHRQQTKFAAGAILNRNTGGDGKLQQQRPVSNRSLSSAMPSYGSGGSDENEASRSVGVSRQTRQTLRQSTSASGGDGGGDGNTTRTSASC
ncbi:unnamed protein product [Pylaiella littoralis]